MLQRRFSVVALLGICMAVAACQRGRDVDIPYARDIERVCNAEERSGAVEQPESQRALVVAQWLGATLESDAARSFLVRLAQANPAGKVKLLHAESRSVGLSRCPLAVSWGGQASVIQPR